MHWSVTPELTTSTYVSSVVEALRDRGVDVQRMTLRSLLRSSNELVHIQWPEHVSSGPGTLRRLAKGARSLVLLQALRRKGHRVVLTAHNLEPHLPMSRIDRMFRRGVERIARAIIVMAPGHVDELETAGLRDVHRRAVLVRHPAGRPLEATSTSDRQALLILGLIASYHQPVEFIEALAAAGSTRRIVIAGEVGELETLDALNALAAQHSWVDVRPGFLDGAEFLEVLESTVALVALQRRPFNSGAPFFAFPQGLPVILTEGPLATDLAKQVGPGWVHSLPRDPMATDVAALDRFLSEEREAPDLSAFAPSLIAKQHVDLYEAIASGDELPSFADRGAIS